MSLSQRRLSARAVRPSLTISHLHERRAAGWSVWLLVVAVIGCVLPLTVAALTGNLAIPHNDSWSYSRIAETFAQTGRIQLLNWNRTSLIGQIVLVWPFGSSLTGQQICVAALSMICLYCVYDLAGSSLDTRRAAMATGLVALWPGWASLATSFMSDIPALSGTFGAVVIGRYALALDSRRLFWAALVVGFWATTVREQSLTAPAALILVGAGSRKQRKRVNGRTVLRGAISFIVPLIAFLVWRNALPDGDHARVLTGISGDLHALMLYSAQSYFTLAAILFPAVLLTVDLRRWRRGSWIAAAIAVVLLLSIVLRHRGVLAGNYLDASGEYDAAGVGNRAVLDATLNHLLTLSAVISGVLMAGTLANRWRALDPLLGVFTLLTALMTALVAATGQGVYDRYLIALAPAVLGVVLAREAGATAPAHQSSALSKRSIRVARGMLVTAAFVFIALISVQLAANAFSFDRATWNAGRSYANLGVPAERVDAGFDWVGWHAPNGMPYRTAHVSPALGSAFGWWMPDFSKEPPCIVVRSSQVSAQLSDRYGWTPLRTQSYRTFLVTGTSHLYVYATHATGCPAVASLVTGHAIST